MGGLFGGGKAPQAQKQQPAGALNVQTSIYGSAYPLVYGKNRVPVNLIHYLNFKSIAHTTKQKTGGKGGGKAQSQTTYTYQVAMAASVGVGGPNTGIGTVWRNKEKHTLSSLGLTFFGGAAGQTAWSYLTGAAPSQAVPYANIAYIAAPAFDLGDSPSLPNLNVEFKGLCRFNPGTNDDALLSDVIVDYLTDTRHGAGFGAYLADLDSGSASFRKYCLARGLFVSPIENNQRNAGAFLKEMAEIANSAMVWRNGKLHFIPYGDVTITGNGATYTPDLTPLYDLTERDFLFEKNQPPVKHSTKNPSQQFNHVRMEFNNRANDYNPSIVEVKDPADIDDNGLRTKPVRKCPHVTLAPLARDIIQLEMQRDLFVVNTYAFRLGVRHSLLEPMDYVTVTETGLGLDRQLVRIVEVTEQDDAIDVIAEEVTVGVANAPLYNTVGPQGYNQDFNASAGNTQDPLIMNAPGMLTTTGYEMWINACGTNFDLWGGCQVWISDDNVSYRYVGSIMGPARYGALAANLSAGSADYDTTSVARVQLYSGQLIGGTQEDVDDWRTLLYVGGEWMSYRDSTLVSGTTYDLDTFRRAGYGSTRAAHSTGQAVAVIDEATFRLPYDAGNVGKQVFFKFPSFNVFGGALQDLAACTAYSHTIGASEMTAPMNFADIGGNGENLLPDQYSFFEGATLPGMTGSGRTLARDTGTKIIGPASLRINPTTDTDAYTLLAIDWNAKNFAVIPGTAYLVSMWVLVSGAAGSPTMRVGISNGVGTYTKDKTLAVDGVWRRLTWRVEVATAPVNTGLTGLVYIRLDGANGRAVFLDGIMVEEAVGMLEEPSSYARGQAGSMAVNAIAAAAAAQDTADGKIDSFFQPTAPASGMSLGDLWFDSDDGNKQYRYNGSSWVLAQDTAIGTAILNAAGAQATADSKIRTFYQTGTPAATGVGDLWYQTNTGRLFRWSGSAWAATADNSIFTVSDIYVVNGQFLQNFDGWTNDGGGWYTEEVGGYPDPLSGSTLHATRAGNAGSPNARILNTKQFAVQAGEAYSVSALLRNYVGGANGYVAAGLVFYNDAGTQLSISENNISSSLVGSGWQRRKTVVIVPAGAVTARATLVCYSHTGGYWFFDDVRCDRLPTSSTENLQGVGKNLIANSTLGGVNGAVWPWELNWNPNGGPVNFRANKQNWTYNGYKMAKGCRVEFWSGAPTGAATPLTDIMNKQYIPVTEGQRYEVSARAAVYRCRLQLVVLCMNAANANLGEPAIEWDDNGGGASQNLGTKKGHFIVMPAGTVKVAVYFRKIDTKSGFSDSVAFIEQPFFGVAGPNQTELSEYNDGPTAGADELSTGAFGAVSIDDLYDYTDTRRLGLRISGSGQRLGSQRNTVRVQTSSYGSVRTTTALSATSAGVVNVNAHSVRYGSFTVSYNAVSSAVTGLTQGSTYVIYCYDGDYSGGTKTYYAGTNPDAIMQLGDDIIVVGQITIPTSGSSSGGGGGGGTNPGDWCVAVDSYLPDGTLAGELPVGQYLPCYNNRPEEPNIVHLRVQANNIGESECLRMVTVSGASIVASVTTPMTLRNGACVLLPEMLHREALVYRYDGSFTWEEVVALEPVGVRRVAKINVSDQCYFAGETKDAFIATHNVQQMKP